MTNNISALRFTADRLSNILRWVVLVGVAFTMPDAYLTDLLILALLIGSALWSAILSALAGGQRRLPGHRYLVVCVDFLLAAGFFALTNGFQGEFGWIGVLPVFTSGIFWGFPRSISWGLLIGLSMGGLALIWSSVQTVLIYGGIYLLGFLLLAGVSGWLSKLNFRRVAKIIHQKKEIVKTGQQIDQARIESLYNLSTELTSSLNFYRVLDKALDLSLSALARPNVPVEPIVSIVMLFNDLGELQVASSRRLTPSDQRLILPAAEGFLHDVIDEGEPTTMKNPSQDPEIRRLVAIRACRSAYGYPLRTGLDVYGVFLFAHPSPDYFNAERRKILEIICKQSAIALQNARLYQALEEEKERMMETQEAARNKLARDLHDGPTQAVAAMAMRVNFARRLMEKDAKSASEELFKIEEMARRTTKEIRQMLFTLRPLILETKGLEAALEAMAAKMDENYHQNVVIQVSEDVVDQIEMGKQGVMFYIVEEAANNARKHAQADHIWVRLKMVQKEIALLEIADDGVGFDVQSVQQSYENRGSLGMVNLRERTELLNGVLQINSVIGKGTNIRVWIPLSEAAADQIHRRA